MGDNEETLRLGFSADTGTISEAVAALKDYISTSQQVVSLQDDIASSATDASNSIDSRLSGAMQSLREQARDTTTEFSKLRDSIRDVKTESEDDSEGGFNRGNLGGSRRLLSTFGNVANRVSPGAGTLFQDAGVVTETAKDLPKLLNVIGDLGPAALIAAPAIAALTVGISVFAKEVTDGKNALDAAIQADNKYYQDVSTLTSEQVKTQIDGLQKRNVAIKDQVESELRVVEIGKQGVIDSFKGIFDGIGLLLGPKIEDALKNVVSGAVTGDLQGNVAKLNAELVSNNALIEKDTEGLKDNAFAANDATASLKAMNDELLQFGQGRIDSEIDTQRQILQLLRTGTQEQLDAARQANQDEIALTNSKILDEQTLQNTFKEGSDNYKAVGATIQQLTDHMKYLTTATTALGDASLDTAVQENEAFTKQQQLQKDSAASYEKYQGDVKKADDSFYDAEIQAHDNYMAKVADINDAAAKQATDLLEKLNEKRADLGAKLLESEADDAQKLHQTQLDDQIKYQRDVEKLTEQHQNTLKQILQDAANQQQELIQNRDFLGLFNLNKTTDQKVQAENDQYVQQRQNLLDNLQQQTDDENRHFAEQEQQRIVDYNRQLTEAQTQYNRQSQLDAKNRQDALNKAQQAYTDQLNLLSQKHTQELQMLRDNEIQSLQLLQQSASQKLQIEQQFYTQSIQLLRSAVAQVSGSSGGGRTGGGGGFSGNLSLTQNITGGSNAGAIADVAAKATQRTLEQFFSG